MILDHRNALAGPGIATPRALPCVMLAAASPAAVLIARGAPYTGALVPLIWSFPSRHLFLRSRTPLQSYHPPRPTGTYTEPKVSTCEQLNSLQPPNMSEGNVQPPKAAVPEAHEVDTYHVPKPFFK